MGLLGFLEAKVLPDNYDIERHILKISNRFCE